MRVALVDDDEIVIAGLRGMLAGYGDRIEIVGTVCLTEDVAPQIIGAEADVVLLDVQRPGAGGLDLVADLLADEPPFRVVIFTNADTERLLFEALRLGVSGYLLKSTDGAALADDLERTHGGEVVIDPTMATQIARRAAHQLDQRWPGNALGLSQRESQVLGLLADGLSNASIASELLVGEETVKTHLRNIYRKLGVKTRGEAVAAALRQGVIA